MSLIIPLIFMGITLALTHNHLMGLRERTGAPESFGWTSIEGLTGLVVAFAPLAYLVVHQP